jgi:integrase
VQGLTVSRKVKSSDLATQSQKLAMLPSNNMPKAARTAALRQLSSMAMEMILRRLKVDVTVHEFRSTFSDWCAERTPFPFEVREMALSHTIANKSEAAYRRSSAGKAKQTYGSLGEFL